MAAPPKANVVNIWLQELGNGLETVSSEKYLVWTDEYLPT